LIVGFKKQYFKVRMYLAIKWSLTADRGVEYEFRVSAANSVDFGEMAVEVMRTPDGGE